MTAHRAKGDGKHSSNGLPNGSLAAVPSSLQSPHKRMRLGTEARCVAMAICNQNIDTPEKEQTNKKFEL